MPSFFFNPLQVPQLASIRQLSHISYDEDCGRGGEQRRREHFTYNTRRL